MSLRLVVAGEASGDRGDCVSLIPADLEFLKKSCEVEVVFESQQKKSFAKKDYQNSRIKGIEKHQAGDWVFSSQPVSVQGITDHSWYFISSLGLPYGWAETSPVFARMKSLNCTLVDLEQLRDAQGAYRCSWGRFPGMIGMGDALKVLGVKLAKSGVDSVLNDLRYASEYTSSTQLLAHLNEVGDLISEEGFPEQAYPLKIALIDGGAFETGIDEALECFPLKTFSVHVMDENLESFSADEYSLYKVVFKASDLFNQAGYPFDEESFKRDPSSFVSHFYNYLPTFQVLINGADWSNRAPRLLTREYLRQAAYLHSNPLPKVALDLHDRMGGPLEILDGLAQKAGCIRTYAPRNDAWLEGIDGSGTTVFSCHGYRDVFAKEASIDFSHRLTRVLEELLATRERREATDAWIPDWLRPAMLLHNGNCPLVK